MSLQAAAQHMASQGRGPDTTLVHMSPKEVRSLQELAMAHGGSLTINPQTGLPEAGFLSSILPMIAGFALGPAGFALMSAPMAGIAVGGLQALRTKSIGKGIMAGLGAYGGAGLGEAFAQTGVDAAAAPELAKAQAGVQQVIGDVPKTFNPLTEKAAIDQYAADILSKTKPYVDASNAAGTAYSNASFADRLGTIGKGIESLGTEPGRNAFMTNIGGAKGLLQTGGAAAAPLVGSLFGPQTKTPPPVDKEQFRYAFDPGRLETPTQVGGIGEYTYFRPSYTRLNPTTKMAADGGTMTSDYTYDPKTMLYSREKTLPQQDQAFSGNAGSYMMGGVDMGFDPAAAAAAGIAAANGVGMSGMGAGNIAGETGVSAVGEATAGPATGGGGSDSPSDSSSAADAAASPYAAGGISHLGDYSDGGRLLRGPGDGVSDSIPATIANKRPARLADGEFVVPARIVSELGNGSTEAGARKLYAMMDRIQKNRNKSVGKGKVAVNSRSDRLLPA